METFSALPAICAGNSPAPGEFPAQRPVTRSFDVNFDLRPNKRLRRHRSHYDVIVMNPALGELNFTILKVYIYIVLQFFINFMEVLLG